MTANGKSRTPKHPLIWLALLTMAVFMNSCRTDEVAVPPLTGPSGARLFINMSADPDHLVIRAPGQSRQSSRITAQLKNQLGQGVPNEIIKFRIANKEGSEVNIGSLSALTATTDGAGFARVVYKSPNSLEQPIPTRIFILAIMTNPAFTFEVTGQHALDLEAAVPPINCVIGGAGAPVAAFTFTPDPGHINDPVCFDAQATTDNGVIVAAAWNFGDGSTGAGITICHTFTSAGLFNVTLTVQDDDRNCSTTTQLITIDTGTSATCSILVTPNNPPLGTSVNLTAVITDDGRVRRFSWNFGDGTTQTTSTNSVSHLYRSAGAFTVLLEIRDDQGNISNCTATVTVGSDAPTCSFTASPSTGSIGDSILFDASGSSDTDGSIVDFTWNFGDGSPSVSTGTDPIINHSYTLAGNFTVTLNVTDDQGNTTTCSISVDITSDAPDCDFAIGQNPIAVGDTASFNASASSDPDGTIVDFTWDFGDTSPAVSTGTNPQATHQYNTAGTFTVTLTITDNDGNTSSCSNTITVGTGQPPTCFFTFTSIDPTAPFTVDFNSCASTDPDGTIASFTWNFGDGTPLFTPTPATDCTVSHDYATAGVFPASVRVTDNDGNSVDCAVQNVTTGNAPTCTFTQAPNPSCVGASVAFTFTGTCPSGSCKFAWTFTGGSPATSAATNPSVTFNSAGSKNVELKVTDNLTQLTCTENSTQTVVDAPTITSFSPGVGAVGTAVTIFGTGFVTAANGGAVDFNGTAATIVSVGPGGTSLQTVVPAGATDGPIHVSNNCGTGTSGTAFDVCGALSINGPAPTNEGSGGGSTPFNFTVNTTNSCSLAQSATFVTTNAGTCGTGGTDVTEDADFDAGSPPTGPVSIPAAASNTPLTIQIDADGVVEGDECFTVTLSSPTNATLGSPTSDDATILNDD